MAERQIFLKPFLYNARLEWKLEGWGKNWVQPGSYYIQIRL